MRDTGLGFRCSHEVRIGRKNVRGSVVTINFCWRKSGPKRHEPSTPDQTSQIQSSGFRLLNYIPRRFAHELGDQSIHSGLGLAPMRAIVAMKVSEMMRSARF